MTKARLEKELDLITGKIYEIESDLDNIDIKLLESIADDVWQAVRLAKDLETEREERQGTT